MSGAQYHFVLKAGNGETILNGERYTSKAGAQNGIASVKVNSTNDARYEKKTASDGSPMFNLKAANGERIGTSETYSSTSARDAGIQSVKSNAPAATTEDQT
jgi:uncharacterized protein